MSYPIFDNVSLGNVSGNIKLYVNYSGVNNLTGIGYNNNSMTFGVNQSTFATPEMIINQIGDVSIIGNVSTGGNLVVNSSGSALQFSDNTKLFSAQAYDQIISNMGVNLSNLGAVWTQNTSAPSGYWTSISISATGQYQSACRSVGNIYTSSNFGLTWVQNTSAPSVYWKSISISSSGEYQTASHSQGGNGYIYTSSNFGATWSLTSAPQKSWSSISISSSGQYQSVIVPFEYLYTSSNYGNTWIQNTSAPSSYWSSISISASGQYQTAITNVYSVSATIYISSNYGKTWKEQLTISSRYFTSISVSATGQYQTVSSAFYSNSYSYIYISSNYGITWIENRSVPLLSWQSVSISATGQYQVASHSNGSSGNIYVSSNYGNIWTQSNSLNVNWYHVAISANGQYITGVVYNGNIYTSNIQVNTFLVDASNNLSYTLGNVLIGNTAPSTSTSSGALQVAGGVGIVGNLNVGGFSRIAFDSSFNGNIQLTQSNNPLWFVTNNASTINATLGSGTDVGIFYGTTSPAAAGLVVSPRGSGGGIKMDIAGNVGIGMNPTEKLHVNGMVRSSDLIIDNGNIHLGQNAGLTSQGANCVAIGFSAGQTSQGQRSIAIGDYAGFSGLGIRSIAIGVNSTGTGGNSIAIGSGANTGIYGNSIAIGAGASCTAANQIVLGTATESVTIPGLITANGGLTMGGANNITLGSGATAPTTGQLGFVYTTNAYTNFTTGGGGDILAIANVPIGTYIMSYQIGLNSGQATGGYAQTLCFANGASFTGFIFLSYPTGMYTSTTYTITIKVTTAGKVAVVGSGSSAYTIQNALLQLTRIA